MHSEWRASFEFPHTLRLAPEVAEDPVEEAHLGGAPVGTVPHAAGSFVCVPWGWQAEPDHGKWAGRLKVVGLDLRLPSAVEAFVLWLRAEVPHLDIIVNNACQVGEVQRPRRPPPEWFLRPHLDCWQQKAAAALVR